MTQQEIDELWKEFEHLSKEECIRIINEEKKLYHHINEMAYSRGQFIGKCGELSEQIHFNIINIIILGNVCPENIYHLRSELLSHINRLLKLPVEKSVKKDKIVFEYIIELCVDNITLKYDNDSMIIDAVKDEIKKGQKDSKNKKTVQYLKLHILPNTYQLMKDNNNKFASTFKALYNAFKYNNVNIFVNEIDKYCI